MFTCLSSQGLFAPRSVLTALVGATALALIGCGGSSGTEPTGTGGAMGSGGSGSGGATGSGGSGSGGAMGSGGALGSGGTVGSGGASVDAPVDMVTMETAADVPMGPFALKSAAFMNGTAVPLMHKCAQAGNPPMGMNISPPFDWAPGPAGTMGYAITLNHQGSGSRHWAIWDIPANVYSLPTNVEHVAMPPPPAPAGSKQTRLMGLDGFTGYGYLGPCPQNPGLQMYVFTLYAIRVATIPGITPMSSVDAIFTAIQGNMVTGGRVTLIGTQTRGQ